MPPVLCLDFDGVLHSYDSGWLGAAVISDPMVPGAAVFLMRAVEHFTVAVYSSRTHQTGGLQAMQDWLLMKLVDELGSVTGYEVYSRITWPAAKPPAKVTIDDRAITFVGVWPDPESLLNFQPWTQRKGLVTD